MTASPSPAEPGAVPAPTINLTAADLTQLLEAAGKKVLADAEHPSVVLAAVKAIPGEVVSGVKAINWPGVVIAVIACAALVLHFPKLTGLL